MQSVNNDLSQYQLKQQLAAEKLKLAASQPAVTETESTSTPEPQSKPGTAAKGKAKPSGAKSPVPPPPEPEKEEPKEETPLQPVTLPETLQVPYSILRAIPTGHCLPRMV